MGKDEWDTKQDTDKFMKNVLCMQIKGTSQAETMPNNEKSNL